MGNPATGRRQRKREEKTRHLLKNAMEIIVESGFDGLTMPGLAERADVAVGGLYRYFTGKQDLLAALQIHSIQQLQEWIEERCESPGLEGVREAVRAVADFASAHDTSFSLLELAVADPRRILDDEQALRVQQALLPILSGVATCIQQAEADGDVKPGNAMRRTMTLWGLVFGCLHFRKGDDRIPDPELHSLPLLEDGMASLLAGWGI